MKRHIVFVFLLSVTTTAWCEPKAPGFSLGGGVVMESAFSEGSAELGFLLEHADWEETSASCTERMRLFKLLWVFGAVISFSAAGASNGFLAPGTLFIQNWAAEPIGLSRQCRFRFSPALPAFRRVSDFIGEGKT